MAAFVDVVLLITRTLVSLYVLALLLRLLLQVARADFYNPISQALVRVTNPLLRPLQRAMPRLAGIDLAALTLAVALQAAGLALIISLLNHPLPSVVTLLLWSLLGVAGMVLNLYFFAVLAAIVLSWVAPGSHHPAVLLLHQLVQPVMAPFRRLLPPLGGLDLSPILVFLAINVVQVLLRHGAMAVNLPAGLMMGI